MRLSPHRNNVKRESPISVVVAAPPAGVGVEVSLAVEVVVEWPVRVVVVAGE